MKLSELPCPSEHHEQVMLVRWAEAMTYRYPELAALAAVPNGGDRHPAVAGKLKAEGVRAGFPDLILPVARGGYHALFVEMKRRRGGTVSAEQREWIARLEANGYCAKVCRGFDEARDALIWYLGLSRRNSHGIS